MKDRVLRDCKPEDVVRVANTFHACKRGEAVDEPGYAKAATLADIRAHDHVLNPPATWAPQCTRTTASPSTRRWPA
jgi:type I restriction enzyme M protein